MKLMDVSCVNDSRLLRFPCICSQPSKLTDVSCVQSLRLSRLPFMFGQFVIEIRFSQKHRPISSSVRPVMTALRSMTMPSYDLAAVLMVKASTSPSVAVEVKYLVLGLNTPTSTASTAHTGPTRTPRQAQAAWCHRGGFSANFLPMMSRTFLSVFSNTALPTMTL